jgi:1-acyl-sn-glycerol-3-phosphate acyltransferase
LKGLIDFSKKLALLIAVWLLGSLLRVIIWLLEVGGRIKIIEYQPLSWKDWEKGNILFASNHPSFLEPVILPIILYFRHLKSLENPILYFPWSTPDEDNFFKPWYFSLLRAHVAIPIPRNPHKKMSAGLAARRQKRILEEGGRIIIFPEGTRTPKAKNKMITSKGSELGELIEGAVWAAVKAKSMYVPIWIKVVGEDFPARDLSLLEVLRLLWQLLRKSKMIIKIGEARRFRTNNPKEAGQELTQALLDLGDR